MPRKNLTAKFCEAVKVETRTDFFDDNVRGLVFRVSHTGVKSWTVIYTRKSDNTKQRVTLGKFPAIGLEAARQRAIKLMGEIADGKDPAGNRRASRESMTVKDLADLFIEKYSKRYKRTWKEDERQLSRDVLPVIGKLKASSVKKRDLLDILEKKVEDGADAQARNMLAVIRKMFNWAVENDYLEISPAMGVKAPGKPAKRDRVLSFPEVIAIWRALESAAMEPETKDIIRLLFLTGQRSGEVCGMIRQEIDIATATWTLPGQRTKNGVAHVVPLVGEAFEIVSKWLTEAGPDPSAPLFNHVGGQSIDPNGIAGAVRKKLQLFDERWTPHDARRTVATCMAGIGIFPHVIEATLNHISGFRAGVAGVYNRAQYDAEKRSALINWNAEIMARVSDEQGEMSSNIISITR